MIRAPNMDNNKNLPNSKYGKPSITWDACVKPSTSFPRLFHMLWAGKPWEQVWNTHRKFQIKPTN